ncbi:hypothetical protein VTK73DRAFT_7048 [Phialemonium thermophilum]|uniref:AB hydrolase-1 domain-containing protein n=1 Tax=Phialemonium thermophilum TaxID=223376 RepID=A0ABR3WH05_9PEZI
MSSAFLVKEHLFEGQHVREYPRATAHSQDDGLYLSVKQYIPKDNLNAQPGDITIIGGHANGFVKELYEPLWEDLVKALHIHGIRVRGIWVADVAWQGQSAIVNGDSVGNDPSWHDHPRDLLAMVNHFRKEMPRPLVGMGHSFGASMIVELATIHPRLFQHLVLLDATISRFAGSGPSYSFSPMTLSTFRRDLWPSRQEAEASFRRSNFYKTWDPRVFDAWVKYGLRDTPTKIYPQPGQVTLTTTKHMEVFTYNRPVAQAYDQDGRRVVDSSKVPDISDAMANAPFYRAEPLQIAEKLPSLRPSVLWLYGSKSEIGTPVVRKDNVGRCGAGVGGSGGVQAGMVKDVVVEGFGHLFPMEVTTLTAEHAAASIVPAVERWRREEAEFQAWAQKPDIEKQVIDDDFKKKVESLKAKPKI